jgi:hypothetical protein
MLSPSSDAGATDCAGHPQPRTIVQIMLAAAILCGGTPPVSAKNPTINPPPSEQSAFEPPSRWEFLVASGMDAPMGAQRHAFGRADLTAVQLSYAVRADFALTGAVGWVRGRDASSVGESKLDIFTYDVGAEFRSPLKTFSGFGSFRSFAGVGAGGRSYRSHALEVDTAHDIAAYISAGGEVGVRRIRLRLEIRDYISGFKSLNGQGSGGARNDVVAMIGLRVAGR